LGSGEERVETTVEIRPPPPTIEMQKENAMNQVAKIEDPALPPKTGALKSGGAVLAVVPQTLDDVYRLSALIFKSGLAPKDLKNPEACTVAILHGMEIGLKPMQALQRIAVINGRPTLWGDAMLGLVQASGLLEDIQESFEGKAGTDEHRAVCVVKRVGMKTPGIGTFSQADAKMAGLFGKPGPHTQYPDRMKQMRARSFALRDKFADVLGGMYSAEEVMDMGEMKDITPKDQQPARPQRKDFVEKVDADGVITTISPDATRSDAESEGGSADTADSSGDASTDDQPDEIWNEGWFARIDGQSIFDVPKDYDAEKTKRWKNGWNAADLEQKAKGRT
jgi:hypothetical protein